MHNRSDHLTDSGGQAPSSLRPIRSTSVAEQAFHQLREMIDSGQWAPGDRLPTERQLTTLLGISRPSVREALRQLEAHGLTYSRPGSGSFVAARDSGRTQLMRSGDERPADLYELREILESAAAARAALRRTPEDLAALRTQHEADRQEPGTGRRNRLQDFHLLVARAAHNPALEAAILGLRQRLDERLWTPMREQDIESNIGVEESLEDHEALLRAIELGQPEQARRLMGRHLSHQIQALLS